MRLSEAVRILTEAGVPDARHDARAIFTEIGGVSIASSIAMDPESESDEVLLAVERRAKREPLQYILGRVFFYNEEYEVSPDCLIPRSDTETLVEYACRNIPEGERFLDLCTGSGCVGISTVRNTKNTKALLVDISESALKLAKRNAALNGVRDRVELRYADLLSCEAVVEDGVFAVLSNPPYVREEDYKALEREIFFEPRIAFVGGEEGSIFYRVLTKVYKDKIDPRGFIAYEIGYDQGELLCKIAEENNLECEIVKDLGGNDRVAVLRKK